MQTTHQQAWTTNLASWDQFSVGSTSIRHSAFNSANATNTTARGATTSNETYRTFDGTVNVSNVTGSSENTASASTAGLLGVGTSGTTTGATGRTSTLQDTFSASSSTHASGQTTTNILTGGITTGTGDTDGSTEFTRTARPTVTGTTVVQGFNRNTSATTLATVTEVGATTATSTTEGGTTVVCIAPVSYTTAIPVTTSSLAGWTGTNPPTDNAWFWTRPETTSSLDTTATITVTDHDFAEAHATIAYRNHDPFDNRDFWNTERIWTAKTIIGGNAEWSDSSFGGFTDYFGSTVDAGDTVTIPHRNSWTDATTVFVTYHSSTESTVAGTDTVNFTRLSNATGNFTSANDTPDLSDTIVYRSDLTGTSTTAMVSGYDTDGSFTTDSVSVNLFGTGFPDVWAPWDRAQTVTETTTVSQTFPVTIDISSSTYGDSTTTTAEWGPASTTFSYVSHDALTTAFPNREGTTGATSETVSGAGGRTRHSYQEVQPTYDVVSNWGHLDQFPVARFKRIGNGYLGFGGGWTTSDARYAGIGSTLASGSHFGTGIELSNAPVAGVFDGMSVVLTDNARTSDFAQNGLFRLSWSVGTGGGATAATAFATFSTISATGTGPSDTVVATTAATYNLGMTGAITGGFYGSTNPVLPNDGDDLPLHRPAAWSLSRVSFGGIGYDTASGHSMWMPAGTASLTLNDSSGGTTAVTSSFSVYSSLSIPGDVAAHGYVEPAVVIRATRGEGLTLETACAYYFDQ